MYLMIKYMILLGPFSVCACWWLGSKILMYIIWVMYIRTDNRESTGQAARNYVH